MPNRVTPKEAAALLEQGYEYVDVRSIPEYQQGHPRGAKNVPFMHLEGGRMVLNPEFMAVMQKLFPPSAKLVIGCKSGGRSLQAATLLERIGYTNLYDMRGGFDAEMNSNTGQIAVAGWSREGLPVEAVTAGCSYEELKK
ncbi:MAG TPA: rhodanese-like domain-containing protein [Polyangia bacterium]|nr:rhodanese-like domain-containing protein [Polyangia bacterium]